MPGSRAEDEAIPGEGRVHLVRGAAAASSGAVDTEAILRTFSRPCYEVGSMRRLRADHSATNCATASGIGLSPATHRRTVRALTLSRRAASIWPMPTRWRWRLSSEGVIAFGR